MGFEPRRADRPVAASESVGFAAEALPSPRPSNQPPAEEFNQELDLRCEMNALARVLVTLERAYSAVCETWSGH
jgi:hypothetical protein